MALVAEFGRFYVAMSGVRCREAFSRVLAGWSSIPSSLCEGYGRPACYNPGISPELPLHAMTVSHSKSFAPAKESIVCARERYGVPAESFDVSGLIPSPGEDDLGSRVGAQCATTLNVSPRAVCLVGHGV